MDDFERELKVGFLEEAAQLLADAEQSFLELEGATAPGINGGGQGAHCSHQSQLDLSPRWIQASRRDRLGLHNQRVDDSNEPIRRR